MPRQNKILNFAWGTITAAFNDADDDDGQESELMVYDTIGKDPWEQGGITSSDFSKAVDLLPARDLNIRVNCKGGDVHEGFAMMNRLNRFRDETGKKVTTVIEGIAASTASWAFPAASDSVCAYSGSQMYVHDAISFVYGNADEMRALADNLDKTSDQIAGIYSEMTGKGRKTMRDLMKNGGRGTLMTADDAKENGFVNKIIDRKAVRNFVPAELASMSNRLTSIYNCLNTNNQPPKGGDKPAKEKERNEMLKKHIIELLNTLGVTEHEGKKISEEMSEEDLLKIMNKVKNEKEEERKAALQRDSSAATQGEIAQLRLEIKNLTEVNNQARTNRITSAIGQLVVDNKLTEAERPAALARALKDETYINELQARPEIRWGSEPVSSLVECTGEKFTDVQNYCLNNGPKFMKNFIGHNINDAPLGDKTLLDIRDHSIMVANTIKKHKKMLVEMWNTNTIDAGLQRQVILQEMLEEYAIILLPLQNFSAVFNNVPLEGTDEVDVPFYPLALDAGNSWAAATGYATASLGDTVTNTRPVVVGGSGANSGAAAPANTARDRKWIGAKFSSYELARQPYLNVQKLMIQKANALGVAIFSDIISRVMTAANFGASIKAEAAAQFTGDDIADLTEVANGRNWPGRGRSLILDHRYLTPLLKDPTFKQYLAYGTTEPLHNARIPNAYGFENIDIVPNFASYSPAGENLVGAIAHMYAMLIATSPIMPTPDVRALMTRYDVVTDPKTGVTFEYRRFGDPILDVTKEVVESSYGANKGVASALARQTSQ